MKVLCKLTKVVGGKTAYVLDFQATVKDAENVAYEICRRNGLIGRHYLDIYDDGKWIVKII